MGAMRAEIASSDLVSSGLHSSGLLSSLASVRDDVERQVAKLDRFRALQAIEKTIADFPGLEDIARSLADIRDNIRGQLAETPEVRALRTVERIMPDLTEVLTFLAERATAVAADSLPPAEEQDRQQSDRSGSDRVVSDNVPSGDGTPDVSPENVTVIVATSADHGAAEPMQTMPPQEVSEQEAPHAVASPLDPGEAPAPANDAAADDGAAQEAGSSPPPAISYGIAQFLNPDEPAERSAVEQTGDDEEGLAQFRSPPSQEGRAA